MLCIKHNCQGVEMLKEKFSIDLPFINESDIVLISDEQYGDTYTFKEPIEHPLYSGFYIVPTKTRYAINRLGIVIDLWRNVNVSFTVTPPNPCKNIKGGYFTSRAGKRHRLLAMVFLRNEVHPARLWVNHKNGIPGDDRLENLEWCTPSQNVQHAYDNNLHPNKVRSIVALNWITNEEKLFSNIAQASRYTGVTHSGICGRLRRSNGNKFPDGWRFKDNGEDWVAMNSTYRKASNEKNILAWNVRNNTFEMFENSTLCNNVTNIERGTIVASCRLKYMTPFRGFIFRYEEDKETLPQFTPLQIRLFEYQDYQEGMHPGIIAYDTDGNETFFGTLPEACAHYGYSSSGIRHFTKSTRLLKNERLNHIYLKGN